MSHDMERVMRKGLSLYGVTLLAAVASACGSSAPTAVCGPGTTSVNGQCQSLVTCGEGTVNVGNICQPESGAGACGEGTVSVEGLCVPSDEACDEGTRLVNGICVTDGALVCGAGTVLNLDDECVPVEILACGPGTVATDVEDGGVTMTICEPVCSGGQVYNQRSSTCVDQCDSGTTFDGPTNTCAPDCADTQYYSPVSDACIDLPQCLTNTAAVGGDCEGWPFHELSMSTVCARRAFNICDPIFDPVCRCDSAGDYNFERFTELGFSIFQLREIQESFELYFSADLSACLTIEYELCEEGGIALIRALSGTNPAEVEIDADALAAFDDHFTIEEGTCSRPVDWEPWPVDLVEAIPTPKVGDGGACSHHWSCDPTQNCIETEPLAFEEDRAPVVPSPHTCQDRVARNAECQVHLNGVIGREGLAEGLGLALVGTQYLDPTDPNDCLEAGDLCMYEFEDEETQCLPLRPAGNRCDAHGECEPAADGTARVCAPTDISPVLDPDDADVELALPTCRDPLVADNFCPTAVFDDGFRTSLDLCNAATRCDDEQVTGDDDPDGVIGKCVTAVAEGGGCDWCDEVVLYPLVAARTESLTADISTRGSNYDNPFFKNGFSVCAGGLNCTLQPTRSGVPSEICSAAVSVCRQSFADVFHPGGICTENNCNDGIDNDGDEEFRGGPYTDCDDPDCFAALNCYESACTGGVDEELDGWTDCDDAQCCIDTACSEICSCTGENASDEAACACHDGLDNDGDSNVDCADSQCTDLASVNELCFCTDVDGEGVPIDNDEDGDANCADLDCQAGHEWCANVKTACAESDDVDQDGDGLVDCADPDCSANFEACAGPTACHDGLDNDGDQEVQGRDCDDPDCLAYVGAPLTEVCRCDNETDDDGDLLEDCDDPDCVASAEHCADPVAPASDPCDDDNDNDGDQLTDCDDPDCSSASSCI